MEEAFGCGALGPVIVLVWRRQPTPERMQRCFEVFERAALRAGSPVGMLAVLEPGTPPAPLSLLPTIAREFDRQAHIHATAGVLEERGPLATVVMDAVTTIASLQRRRHPVKLCTDAREAITWLSRRLGIEPEHRELLDAIERVRDALPLRNS